MAADQAGFITYERRLQDIEENIITKSLLCVPGKQAPSECKYLSTQLGRFDSVFVSTFRKGPCSGQHLETTLPSSEPTLDNAHGRLQLLPWYVRGK